MFDYQMFAEDTGTNLNTTATMPDEIKTYYDDYLIDCSLPKLVHDQFGQSAPSRPGAARPSSSARSARCRSRPRR